MLKKNPRDKTAILELQLARARLIKTTQIKTKWAILRCKARRHEKGERNTKYFFSLEKRNHDNKTITKIKLGEDSYI